MTPKKQLVVKYNGFKVPKLGLLPKALTTPRQGYAFGKVTANSSPQLSPALPPLTKALKGSPANTGDSPEVATKKKMLQAKLKKMIKGAPKRAVKLGKNLAHNAAPMVAKAQQGVQGAFNKGAKVVRQAIDNYQMVREAQKQQKQQQQQLQMMTANTTDGQTTTPTIFSTTAITTTDDETDDEALDIEQFLANEKIANMVEFGKVNGAKENLNLTPNEDEIVDTREIALGYSDWHVENSCRSQCVWFLILVNLVLLISLICDVVIYTGVLQLLLPFGNILNTQMKPTDVVEEESNEKYRTSVLTVGILTLFFASIRIFLLLKVMEMEDSDYQAKPSSFPCSFFQFFTLIMIVFLLFITAYISSNLEIIEKNFEDIFKAKEEIYANFSSPNTMIEMDKLQQTFRCCGSSGIKSWYGRDLYSFLRDDNSTEVYLYWERFNECHKSSTPEVKQLVDIHSIEPVKGKIKSVPFSCCSAEVGTLCNFYNHNNYAHYWKIDPATQTLYNTPCKDVVKPKLSILGLKIESLYFYRLLLEVIMFLVMYVVQSSFDSYYESHHRPSIATLPLCWALIALIGLALFYTFKLRFFIWKYSFKVFFGLDPNKLATSLQENSSLIANSTS